MGKGADLLAVDEDLCCLALDRHARREPFPSLANQEHDVAASRDRADELDLGVQRQDFGPRRARRELLVPVRVAPVRLEGVRRRTRTDRGAVDVHFVVLGGSKRRARSYRCCALGLCGPTTRLSSPFRIQNACPPSTRSSFSPTLTSTASLPPTDRHSCYPSQRTIARAEPPLTLRKRSRCACTIMEQTHVGPQASGLDIQVSSSAGPIATSSKRAIEVAKRPCSACRLRRVRCGRDPGASECNNCKAKVCLPTPLMLSRRNREAGGPTVAEPSGETYVSRGARA